MARTSDRSAFLNAVKATFGELNTITRAQIVEVCEKNDIKWPGWLVCDKSLRVDRGVYSLSGTVTASPADTVVNSSSVVPIVSNIDEMTIANLHSTVANINLVPSKATGYVPFGHFNDIRSIIRSKRFYPTYVTGLSGNGKTMMIEQICANEGRELVRANITKETDEDDLIGGFRLIDGKTVWQNGPVLVAMERGSVLLLDEVDLGDAKLMCLQPILEGKSVYVKKINKVVSPAAGFTIVATANTKGKGSDDGRFIGTNVMNEAFLERFSITFEQEYPALKVEQKIINNVFSENGVEAKDFADKLVQWADVIRKSFYEGAVSDIISTRRLVHIAQAYTIFGQDREKAIKLCLNRFDIDTKNSFLDLYMKLDDTLASKTETVEQEDVKTADTEIAF
jgi:MoxR-like ATPase